MDMQNLLEKIKGGGNVPETYSMERANPTLLPRLGRAQMFGE